MNTASWPTSPSIRPASCFPMIILSPIRSSTRFRTVWRRRGFLNSTRTAPAGGRLKPLLENYVDSMQAVKIGRGHFFFVPRTLARLQVFEDFVEMLEEHSQLKRPDRDPLEVNSIYVVDDAKQRKKMTAAFYRSVRRGDCRVRGARHPPDQSGSQSPKIMDRWVMRIQGLEEKKRNYEEYSKKRELTDLDEEFTSLRYLSDELRIRAAGGSASIKRPLKIPGMEEQDEQGKEG